MTTRYPRREATLRFALRTKANPRKGNHARGSIHCVATRRYAGLGYAEQRTTMHLAALEPQRTRLHPTAKQTNARPSTAKEHHFEISSHRSVSPRTVQQSNGHHFSPSSASLRQAVPT